MYSEFNECECEYESECRRAICMDYREERGRRVEVGTIEMWVSQTLPSLDC